MKKTDKTSNHVFSTVTKSNKKRQKENITHVQHYREKFCGFKVKWKERRKANENTAQNNCSGAILEVASII